MGTYGLLQILPAELVEDAAGHITDYLDHRILAKVKGGGLHPTNQPRHTWLKLTQADVVREREAQQAAGLDPIETFRIGDWRVLSKINIEEDAPAEEIGVLHH